MYKKARAGEIKNFTGVSDPYEEPANCDLNVNTGEMTLDQSVDFVMKHMEEQGVMKRIGAGDKYKGQVVTLDHIGVIKHLMSMLRDKTTDTRAFRQYSDRIMRLLVEEAINQDLAAPVKKLSPTGDHYDHYMPKFADHEYTAVTILRAGDSMLNEVFDLIPGISIGKVLIQRDESTKEKKPVYYYSKLPEDLE
jgi:hypothetical protein